MGLPFGFGYQPDNNFYFSGMLFDMTNGSYDGSRRIRYNAAMDDIEARWSLYDVPTGGFTGCSRYPSFFSALPDYLDPAAFALHCKVNLFDKLLANIGEGPMDMYTPGNTDKRDKSKSKDSDLSANEQIAKDRYEKIADFTKKIFEGNDWKQLVGKKTKIEIEKAIEELNKDDKKTWAEKLTEIQSQLDKIDNAKLKNFVIKHPDKFKMDNSSDAENLSDSLRSAGYESENGIFDKSVNGSDFSVLTLSSDIASLTNANVSTSTEKLSGALTSIKAGSADILDLLSSWNSKFGKDGIGDDSNKDKGKRILDYIGLHYNKLDEDKKATVKTNVIQPLITTLVDRAKEITENENSGLDDTTLEALKTKITALETKAAGKGLDKIESYLTAAYNELYIATRRAAIAVVRNEMNEYYKEIDDKVFNDSLFEDETIADLKAEGFSDNEIEAAKATSLPAEEVEGGVVDNIDLSAKSLDEQVEYLTGTNDDEKVYMEAIGTVSGMQYYREKGGKQRIIAKYNGSLHVVTNREVTIENGKIKCTDSGTVELKPITANEIISGTGYQANVKDDKDSKADQTNEATSISKVTTPDASGRTTGDWLYEYIDDYTDGDDHDNIRNIIETMMDEHNVFHIIKDFNKHGSLLLSSLMQESWFDDVKENGNVVKKGKDKLYKIIIDNVLTNLKSRTQTDDIKNDIKTLEDAFKVAMVNGKEHMYKWTNQQCYGNIYGHKALDKILQKYADQIK